VKSVLIIDNLCRGFIENLNAIKNDNRFHIIEEDIKNKNELESLLIKYQCDTVFLLAALWLNHCQEYPGEGFLVNLEGTKNVFEVCASIGVDKVIFSSSASVYGEATENPMNETHPFNNTTMYGATKIGGEALLKAYCSKYNMKGVSLRYFNVYGPRQDYEGAYIAVMMRMIDNILNNKSPVVFGDGLQSFDFINVKDIARANLLAAQYDGKYDEFNVCTGISTFVKTIAEMLLKIMKSDLDIEYKKGDFPVSNRLGGVSKAHSKLGFESNVKLIEGLTELVEWRKLRWEL
jgi:UDP-glucose 4-epimerase